MPEPADGNQIPQQRNVEVVRRFIDGCVNGGDLDVIDQTWSDDMSWHGGSLGTHHGRDAFKQFTKANAAGAFADMHLEIHELIAQGDKVVARFTNSGTNTGPFLNNPPTGKHAAWLGIGIYTLRNNYPVYASSKAALNMLTIKYAAAYPRMRINSVDPGFTATDFNQHRGTQTVEEGAEAIVRYALIPADGPTGGFFDRNGAEPW